MSATTSALIMMLLGAPVWGSSIATLVAPPPEPGPVQEPPPSDGNPDPSPAPPEDQGDDPSVTPSGRDALPPGLQPVPFPLENSSRPGNRAENQRRTSPPTGDDPNASPPTKERRSIVDLRDPFDRPPPQPNGQRDPTARLLMPDLKDPFAPGVRRVRSKTLDSRVPNDIRDPFRNPPPGGNPTCVKTTSDGTVVQAPGKKKVQSSDCQPPRLDLRDPFDRDAKR